MDRISRRPQKINERSFISNNEKNQSKLINNPDVYWAAAAHPNYILVLGSALLGALARPPAETGPLLEGPCLDQSEWTPEQQ